MRNNKIFIAILIVMAIVSSHLLVNNPSPNFTDRAKPNKYEQEILRYEEELLLVTKKNKKENLKSVSAHIAKAQNELRSAREKFEEFKHTGPSHKENVKVDLEFHLEHTKAYLKMANYPFIPYSSDQELTRNISK